MFFRFVCPAALTIDQQTRALVIFVAATASLVQYPFPAPVYFCYVAPLVALAAAAVFTANGRAFHPVASLLLVFYVLFAAFRLAPGFIYRMGRSYRAGDAEIGDGAPAREGPSRVG